MIKCFIACAFGREEVEYLFEHAIKEALSQLKIKVLRVDKINHNEKIDQKILDLINQADFGIADLTFARPSVYFEAGILQGQGKQVIYLARKDHLTPLHDDLYGNFKIHFDLITCNIILWNQINNSLIEVLKKRISLVVKPMQKQRLAESKTLLSQTVFHNLSVAERIETLHIQATQFIRNEFKDAFFVRSRKNTIVIILNGKTDPKLVIFLLVETTSKTEIGQLKSNSIYWRMPWSEKEGKKKVVVLITLRSIREATIDSALDSCRKTGGKSYEEIIPGGYFRYFVLDKILDEADLQKRFSKIKI
jgi:nucleoside 2-deoxyribosyltransferase